MQSAQSYIVLDDFPSAVKDGIVLTGVISPDAQQDASLSEGYILRNTGTARNLPQPKNYVKPVPNSQISLYKSYGYTLSQTKEWQSEN